MDLEFTQEQEELRDAVRSVLERECPISLVRSIVESASMDRFSLADGLWKTMVGLDWPALSLDEEIGGVGCGFVETAVLAEELGAVLAPGPLVATAFQYAPLVAKVATAEQRQRLLEPVATGSVTGAVAFADHPRRWQVEDLSAAVRSDGSIMRFSGTKHSVLGLPGADSLALVARRPDGALGAFVVDPTLGQITAIDALDRSRPLASITFEGVEVEPLGVGEVEAAIRSAISEMTTALALECIGSTQALFDLVLAYAKDRHQFGVPIGSFQAVKHKMADCFVAIERARALCYYAVAALAEEDTAAPLAASMAKAAADDAQRYVGQEAIQTFGGIGFTWEHDAHLYVKRMRTCAALFGAGPDHRLAVAASFGLGAKA